MHFSLKLALTPILQTLNIQKSVDCQIIFFKEFETHDDKTLLADTDALIHKVADSQSHAEFIKKFNKCELV